MSDEIFDEKLATYCATEGCGILIGYGEYKAVRKFCSRCQRAKKRDDVRSYLREKRSAEC